MAEATHSFKIKQTLQFLHFHTKLASPLLPLNSLASWDSCINDYSAMNAMG